MNPHENINNNFVKTEDEHTVNVREVLGKYFYHWPVFVLTIIICLSVAFFYLRYSQKVYSVNSTLMIKDEKKGGMAAGGDLLNDLDLFGSSKVIDNEIEILKSKTLMRKVVERLNLMVSFQAAGRIINSEVYSNKSLKFGVVELADKYYGKTFKLNFPTRKTYQINDLENGEIVEGKLGEIQRNQLGVYKIDVDQNFINSSLKDIEIHFADPQLVANQLLSRLTISLAGKQSTVLALGFETSLPQQGQDILNTLVQVYNEAALADNNRNTQSTIQFIEERLKLISGELTEVERDVESFKSSRGLTDISSDANLYLESVKANDLKLNEVNLQYRVIKDIQRYVNSNSVREKLPSTLGINDPVLLGQITQLSELQLEKDRLLETTTEDNPLVAPIIKQIETTRSAIQSAIRNISKTLEVSKAGLEGNNLQFQNSIKKIPGQERQLISIKRQQTIKESLYLYLLQKKEEAALSYASSIADSRIVDPAFYSKAPIKPKKQFVFLAALMLGLILPAGYIYIRELLNNKIESAADISKITETPILGEILFNENSGTIVVHENSRTAISEQFRSIRTNMQFLHGRVKPGRGKVTLFTSSMSGEGKSFVASNLAIALAIGGKKTVLIELDLRKPKITKYLKLSHKIGLSNFLIGKAGVEEIIQSSTINENFFVIGSGPIPPNPSELLVQDDIVNLIEYLKDNFDEILIDTPPIGLVTDAQVLSRLADATIYLVRQDITYKDQISNLNNLFKNNKLPRLNIILNGIKLGGGFGYGHSYGYGYGYYTTDEINNKIDLKSFLKNIIKRL